MSDTGPTSPEIGTLTADGSRAWDGRFWVRTSAGHQLDALPTFEAQQRQREAAELSPEARSYRLGRAVLAAVVGLIVAFIPIPAPSPASLDSALTELAVVSLLRVLCTFGAVVVILSLGRQGIDVLLFRAMFTAFLMGVAVMSLFFALFVAIPIPVMPRVPWPVIVIAIGLLGAVQLGPVVTLASALANLLWYRSLGSLRAQLGIFSRIALAVALAINIGFSSWASMAGHNFGFWVLDGGPAAAILLMLFLFRKGLSAPARTAT